MFSRFRLFIIFLVNAALCTAAYFEYTGFDETKLNGQIAELTECCTTAGVTEDDLPLKCDVKQVGDSRKSDLPVFDEYIKYVPESCKDLFKKTYDLKQKAGMWGFLAMIVLLLSIVSIGYSKVLGGYAKQDKAEMEIKTRQEISTLAKSLGAPLTQKEKEMQDQFKKYIEDNNARLLREKTATREAVAYGYDSRNITGRN